MGTGRGAQMDACTVVPPSTEATSLCRSRTQKSNDASRFRLAATQVWTTRLSIGGGGRALGLGLRKSNLALAPAVAAVRHFLMWVPLKGGRRWSIAA
jgi:hypothetical protein